jgi:hypothetical protein
MIIVPLLLSFCSRKTLTLPQNSNENQASESFYKTTLDFPWNTKSLDDD